MNGLVEQVERAIGKRKLLRDGERVLLGVSGGVDSMVLLDVLSTLAGRHGWELVVAHYNHQLRGRSSDADERLVRKVAKELGWKCVVGGGDVREAAKRGKVSLEMAARKMRHEFFSKAARELKISTVALGHHADDQVELFFVRLFRGTSGEGLSGMKWSGPSPISREVRLIRPLLDVERATLEEYATERGIKYREDATNALCDIQRNRIRHKLLPQLRREYQVGLSQVVLRLMETVGAESDYVTEAAKDWLKKRGKFDELPVAVQRRCVQLQLLEMGVTSEHWLIEQLREQAGLPVTVTKDLRLMRSADGGILRIDKIEEGGFREDGLTLKLKGAEGRTVFDGLEICWVKQKPGEIGSGGERFDAGKIGARIVLRHWRAGDRFQPIGMKSAVKLQDLFVNQKIPRGERHGLVVATTASGELFWVEKLRISERFKMESGSKDQLTWRWKRL